MDSALFQKVYPQVLEWIQSTLAQHEHQAQKVAAFRFPRLGQYFSPALLQEARVVLVDQCPVPPLAALGLSQFSEFEKLNAGGVTYLNTYFVLHHEAGRESLHFHELVHVLQWQVLGPKRFLARYGAGLEAYGYRNSPLERMAYDHEIRFKAGATPYDVEEEVRQELAKGAW